MPIEIEGVPPFDGSYDFDLEAEPLTMWDFHIIKKISGARGSEVSEAFAAGDVDVIVAFAVISLKRAGKITKEQAVRTATALGDAKVGTIRLIDEPEAVVGDDAGPPVIASVKDSSNDLSGSGSNGTGDGSPATPPAATGSPPSDMAATFAPPTSVISPPQS